MLKHTSRSSTKSKMYLKYDIHFIRSTSGGLLMITLLRSSVHWPGRQCRPKRRARYRGTGARGPPGQTLRLPLRPYEPLCCERLQWLAESLRKEGEGETQISETEQLTCMIKHHLITSGPYTDLRTVLAKLADIWAVCQAICNAGCFRETGSRIQLKHKHLFKQTKHN